MKKIRIGQLGIGHEYAAGTHLVNAGAMNGRYEGQPVELARVIRKEIANPYPYGHERLTQETLLAAAGYTRWEVKRWTKWIKTAK